MFTSLREKLSRFRLICSEGADVGVLLEDHAVEREAVLPVAAAAAHVAQQQVPGALRPRR